MRRREASDALVSESFENLERLVVAPVVDGEQLPRRVALREDGAHRACEVAAPVPRGQHNRHERLLVDGGVPQVRHRRPDLLSALQVGDARVEPFHGALLRCECGDGVRGERLHGFDARIQPRHFGLHGRGVPP